jgi:GNAT superfamily N-acetyltransferase
MSIPILLDREETIDDIAVREENNLEEDKIGEIADFLYDHLGEYGDPREDIKGSLEYVTSEEKGKGGFVLGAYKEDDLVGVLVINDTGMEGYIPEHILVYIAVDADERGQGIGKKLIHKAKELAEGNIALHVEYDNPARKLYEKLGFESKYAEMRYSKD